MRKITLSLFMAMVMVFSIVMSAGVFAGTDTNTFVPNATIEIGHEFDGLNNYDNVSPGQRQNNEKILKEKLKKYEKELTKIKNERNSQGKSSMGALSSVTYSVYVPVIKQILGFNCGAATALQTVKSRKSYDTNVTTPSSSTKSYWFLMSCCVDGNLSNTASSNWKHPSGTTSHAKCYRSYTSDQVTMNADCSVSYNGATMIGAVNGINKYTPTTYNYTAYQIPNTTDGKSKFRTYSLFDMKQRFATVYKCKLNYLTHYGSSHTGVHFISGSSYVDSGSYTTDTIGLTDCNYSSLGGTYSEQFSNVFNAICNTQYENLGF